MTLPTIARNTDPETSHEAAERITESGSRVPQCAIVLDAVRQHPGSTAAEIGEYTRLGHVPAQRRLGDLLRQGTVRQGEPRACYVKGSRMCTWWLAERQATMEDFL